MNTVHNHWSNCLEHCWIKGVIFMENGLVNPNTIKSYKISQKLSPKHAARGVTQSPYSINRHGKACLSRQPPWRAAGDPRLAGGKYRVRAPGPVGTLRMLFFPTLPSFFLREIVFSHLPHQTHESVRVIRWHAILKAWFAASEIWCDVYVILPLFDYLVEWHFNLDQREGFVLIRREIFSFMI